MDDRPQTWFEIMSQAQFLMPSLVGGVIGFFRRFQRDPDEAFPATCGRFLMHVAASGFNGYLVMGFGADLGISPSAMGASCAVAGYLGGTALDWVEDIVRRRMERL